LSISDLLISNELHGASIEQKVASTTKNNQSIAIEFPKNRETSMTKFFKSNNDSVIVQSNAQTSIQSRPASRQRSRVVATNLKQKLYEPVL